MSFNNGKLVHTFGSFIYFAFPASADNMSDMRSGGSGGGGEENSLKYKKVIGKSRWMGSHFHDWSDSNGGDAFSIDLSEWGRKFSDFLG